jgi:hypothetical protein
MKGSADIGYDGGLLKSSSPKLVSVVSLEASGGFEDDVS